jgi:hypothetical protein
VKTNVGHGWVVPRADGARVRCGGPGLCMACQAEILMLRAEQQRGGACTVQPTPGVYGDGRGEG